MSAAAAFATTLVMNGTERRRRSWGKTFGDALRGFCRLWERERNFRVHAVAASAVVAAGFALNFRPWEWTAVLLCIAMVIVAEAFNSAIEALADAVHPEEHDLIGCAKDVAAAGVLAAALISVAVAGLIAWARLSAN